MPGLSNKVALITGARSGIGRAAALGFAARGGKVVITERRPEPLERTAAGHTDIIALVADVAEPDDTACSVARAVTIRGRPDVPSTIPPPARCRRTAGICLDVIGLRHEVVPAAEIARIVEAFPRLDMKRPVTLRSAIWPETTPRRPTTVFCTISASASCPDTDRRLPSI